MEVIRTPKRYRSGESRVAEPRRRQPPGGAATRPRHLRRNRRLFRAAAIVLTVTWLPGIAGNALSMTWLAAAPKACGYIGLSWALPAYFVGLAIDETTRTRGMQSHRLFGIAAWAGGALVLLISSAALIGS